MENIKVQNAAIRPMEIEDLDRVVEIENLCFAMPWSRKAFCDEIALNEYARLFVADVWGNVAGYSNIMMISSEAHINNIAVHPDYRRMGIGAMLIKNMLQVAWHEHNITQITLEVRKSNIAARHLYRKFGFAVEGERRHYYRDNKEDALIMWCRDTRPYLL